MITDLQYFMYKDFQIDAVNLQIQFQHITPTMTSKWKIVASKYNYDKSLNPGYN